MALSLNLESVVYSRREGNLVISHWDRDERGPGIWLRDIFGGESRSLYRLDLLSEGQVVSFKINCQPHLLRLEADKGFVELVFSQPNLLRVRGEGVDLRYSRRANDYGGLVKAPDGGLRSMLGGIKLHMVPLRGKLEWEAPWFPQPMFNSIHHKAEYAQIDFRPESNSGSGALFEGILERYQSEIHVSEIKTAFEEDVEGVKADFDRWRTRAPHCDDPDLKAARDLAVYVLWSSVVPKTGNFNDPAMLMSKRGMCKCWNWDNYFNAWAMTYIDPEFAWGQYRLHMDHQHELGALGDAVTETEVQYQYTKPPVHGWILKRMIEAGRGIGMQEAIAVYPNLVAWTHWWFRYRDDDQDGVCQYNHGNDSGWDNATVFDMEMPVESPELSALLVVQMDFLSDIASAMGNADEAADWRSRSDALLAKLIDHFWKDGQFAATQNESHQRVSSGDCLLPHLSIVLGKRLPEPYLEKTARILGDPDRFLTAYGLATEAVNSPLHLNAGYWRGSIWAPAMMFAIDGLQDAGHAELSRELALRYCRMCAQSGFSENYDPSTGSPLFDPCYTWSASAFFVCLARYVEVGEPATNRDRETGSHDQTLAIQG